MRKEPAEQPGRAEVLYLFSDHLGSTSVACDTSNGTWVTQRYYPWGTIRPGPGNSLPTDYTFTGQKLDESTGLMYYGARYYDPVLGRFVQADPIVPEPGNPQDLNRYSYVRNNPLRYVDPTGFCIPEECPGVPEAEYPTDPTGLRGEEYAAWLVNYLLWLEREKAATGGMAWIEPVQQGVAAELAPFLMKDPELLGDILYQEVMGAMPQFTAQLAGASTDVLVSTPGWVLGMVRRASRTQSGARMVMHHTVPREILEKYLSEEVADAVRGKKRAPNRWPIPEDVHKDIHRGPGGGRYNQRWIEELNAVRRVRGEITAEDVRIIRDKLIREFGLEVYRR